MTAAIVVTGATSIVGRYLVPLLRDDGHDQVLISRAPPEGSGAGDRTTWVRTGLEDVQWVSQVTAPVKTLIHLAPLPLLAPAVTALQRLGLQRIIAFGTTSRLTKAGSRIPAERRMVAEQTAAEDWLARFGASSGVDWTLFRPTMIYDGVNDKNIALIRRFIDRFGFFPLIGNAGGKRQPVHAEDLAIACWQALANSATFGRTYNLAGDEILGYREMVDRVFASLQKRPRYVRIPPSLLRTALGLARTVPRYRYLNPAMADRMDKDMTFNCADAVNDFGYRPRKFTLCQAN